MKELNVKQKQICMKIGFATKGNKLDSDILLALNNGMIYSLLVSRTF